MSNCVKMLVVCTFFLPIFGVASGGDKITGKRSQMMYHHPYPETTGGSCGYQLRNLRNMVRDIRLDCQNAWDEARCFRRALGDVERELDRVIYSH